MSWSPLSRSFSIVFHFQEKLFFVLNVSSQKSGHLVLWSLKLSRQNSDQSTNSPNQKSENLPKSPNQKSGNLSELLTVESVIETDLGSISCLVWKEIGENRFLIFVAAKDGRIKCYKVSLEFLTFYLIS